MPSGDAAGPVEEAPRGWREALLVYRNSRVLAMLFLGFSAGLPFLLVFSTLSAWLRFEGIERTTIGFFSWVGITYSIKFFWAPVVDRMPLPFLTRRLGRRRSWMLLAMCGIAAGLTGMALTDPTVALVQMALLALLVAFSSATQDVALDAWRIEAVEQNVQGAMAAAYQLGYRIATLLAGAGALLIADGVSWAQAYGTMAVFTLVGIVTVFCIAEPARREAAESWRQEARVLDFLARSDHMNPHLRGTLAWLTGAVICPFVDFFSRIGPFALVILLFISLFRISDLLMGVMANPFYIDTGFTLQEIAAVSKVFGFFMTILGAFIGGIVVARYGLMRPLLVSALLLALTNLFFALVAWIGRPDIALLTLTISADNLAAGLSGTVFIAYLSSLTSTSYTATQYALFTSLMTLPGKVMGGGSGALVDAVGYTEFFIWASAAGVPAVLLAIVLMRRERRLRRLAAAAGPAIAAGES